MITELIGVITSAKTYAGLVSKALKFYNSLNQEQKNNLNELIDEIKKLKKDDGK
jgi:hypothetical protein